MKSFFRLVLILLALLVGLVGSVVAEAIAVNYFDSSLAIFGGGGY